MRDWCQPRKLRDFIAVQNANLGQQAQNCTRGVASNTYNIYDFFKDCFVDVQAFDSLFYRIIQCRYFLV